MKSLKALALIAMTLAVSACATKNYGRQGEVTSYERSTLTCREIDIETAKVHGFLQHVDKESEFDGRSVLSFLGDFGMGNVMEKSSAMESATTRLAQLQQARTSRNCGASIEAQTPPPAASVSVAVAPATQTSTLPEGKFEVQVQRLATQQACNTTPLPTLTAKGPGFEAWSVACSNGDAMMVRCEFGNCRVLK